MGNNSNTMEKHTTKYNNWEYEISYNNESPIPVLKIKPDKPLRKPETLSKYYSLNEDNVKAFLNDKFYIAQPDQFNDLFDSNLSLINFDNRPFEHFIPTLNPENIEDARRQFNKDKESFLSSVKSHIYKEWVTILGALCMTEDKTNELMWAHYTNNEGFLIEFNYFKFSDLFMGPYPINYPPLIKPIDFSKIDNNIGFFIASLIKKKIWEYEHEYRFLCRPKNGIGFKVSGDFDNHNFSSELQSRFISYTRESIKKVILGFAFYKDDIIHSSANYTIHEYEVIFNGENAMLKSHLLRKLVDLHIPTELIVQDRTTFKLIAIPIDIKHINETKYIIKEYRQ